jgi:hypothetical protein
LDLLERMVVLKSWGAKKILIFLTPIMNMFEYGIRTATEEQSLQLAMEVGLVSAPSMICALCQGNMMTDRSKMRHGVFSQIRCNRRSCRRRKNIFEGTIFEKSCLKISEIMRILYCYAMKLTVESSCLHTGVSASIVVE